LLLLLLSCCHPEGGDRCCPLLCLVILSKAKNPCIFFRASPVEDSSRSAGEKPLILLPLLVPLFFFRLFSPEMACQAPKCAICFECKNMRVARLPRSIRYTGYIDQINFR
jgi:hypothetical protein